MVAIRPSRFLTLLASVFQVLGLKWNAIAQLLKDVKSGDKNVGSQVPYI